MKTGLPPARRFTHLLRRASMALLLTAVAATLNAASVRDFGAVGDGQADDTAAVEKAVASGAVFFPKGTYRITHTITVELEKTGFASLSGDGTGRVLMEGTGPAFHFVGTHGGTA